MIHKGAIQIALGAILISFSSVFVKLANLEPTSIGFYRMFIGGVFLFVFIKRKNENLFVNKKHFILALICGFIFSCDLFCWHQSIKIVGPGLATLLAAFQVFLLAGFGIFFLKEKPSLKLLTAILLAIFGLYLLVGISWNSFSTFYQLGIVFGLLTACCYALYVLVLNKAQKMHCASNAATLTLVTLFSALFLGLFALIQGQSFVIKDSTTLYSLLAYGLVSQFLGWQLIANGIVKTKTSLIGLLLLLQPALSFVWDILFFNRVTSLLEYVGLGIALFAIYLGSMRRKT